MEKLIEELNSYKNEIDIEIKGMGSTIGHETYLIAEFLKSKGYEVEINDKYPPEKLDLTRDFSKRTKIKITTNHLPWPG